MNAFIQEPQLVTSTEGCFFYHTLDLPEVGLQVGHWDLRSVVDDYLGHLDFEGKTVVDVGSASGFLAFELEKRGANVVAFDRDWRDTSDDAGLIPFADYRDRFGLSLADAVQSRANTMKAVENSFWLAHRLLGSKARRCVGNVYDGLPVSMKADIVILGSILLHLRDPLQALIRFSDAAQDTMIITDTVDGLGYYLPWPILRLRASTRDVSNVGTWWSANPALLRSFLEVLGFRRFSCSTYHAWFEHGKARVKMFTLVAHRRPR